MRNHRFRGSEGVCFGTVSVTFSDLDSGPHLLTFFVDFCPPGASILGSRGPPFRHLFFSRFWAGFRVPPGVPGRSNTWRRSGVPGRAFIDISPQIGVFTVCLLHFRFWGFPVPLRERLPIGNLPLSEVLCQSKTLTDTGGSSGGYSRMERPVVGTPHA